MVQALKSISNAWVTTLVIYFCAIILGCLITTAWIWKPAPQLPSTHIQETINTTKVDNSSDVKSTMDGTRTININSTIIIKDNNTHPTYKVTTKVTFVPSSIERERTLLELALLFGAVGASVHAVTSLVIWQSKNKLERSFVAWYVTRPLIGAALAAAVYFLLRSTLLTTVSGPQVGGVTFINEYGVAGISVLVGLMTGQMTQKLRDVFDSMFGIQKQDKDKGDIDLVEGDNLTMIPKTLQVNIGQTGVLVAEVKSNVNNPVSNVGVEFAVVDSNVVVPLESTVKKSDSNGMAIFTIRGNAIGKTKVYAATVVEDKTVYGNVTVEVTTPTPTPTPTPTKLPSKANS
jgi:hypothetical protein